MFFLSGGLRQVLLYIQLMCNFRYSDFLMKEDSDLAVPFCTAIGDSRRLAEFFMSRGQMSDAVLTAQVACEGAFTRSRPVSADSRQWNGTASPSEQNVR